MAISDLANKWQLCDGFHKTNLSERRITAGGPLSGWGASAARAWNGQGRKMKRVSNEKIAVCYCERRRACSGGTDFRRTDMVEQRSSRGRPELYLTVIAHRKPTISRASDAASHE
ncbi:hypothetical protein [Bradyrhizobium sp. BWA-3-5]|uniref:hypothetical protein n=1 Tax=Bradyrhizobium sp. BWA-3-5 TaxID=3080013 RepID=UPI00293E0B7E|nr:hypothetical protein [Bradyrhizobium sp. BWA-3-5]WOH70081.1 hypothetical protein RX331_25735 [Bradyrhizobium sp. BWA-3-5]